MGAMQTVLRFQMRTTWCRFAWSVASCWAAVALAAPGPALPKGAWYAPVHAALQAAIERHSGDPDAYAVFDFDMTCPIGDCGHCTLDQIIREISFASGSRLPESHDAERRARLCRPAPGAAGDGTCASAGGGTPHGGVHRLRLEGAFSPEARAAHLRHRLRLPVEQALLQRHDARPLRGARAPGHRHGGAQRVSPRVLAHARALCGTLRCDRGADAVRLHGATRNHRIAVRPARERHRRVRGERVLLRQGRGRRRGAARHGVRAGRGARQPHPS